MKFISKACFILLFALTGSMINAQQFTLDFSSADVNCAGSIVCYDATIASNGDPFNLGFYNLRMFYDASRLSYAAGSANINNLPAGYTLSSVQNQLGDGTGLGSLPFEASLAFLEVPVDYINSSPVSVTAAPVNVVQNLCFNILDPTILTDAASCFDLLWVNETSRELYTTSVTTINNPTTGTSTDVANSTYNDLLSGSNCISSTCAADPCNPIVDADGDGVCDLGASADPDPSDPCNPNPTSPACLNSELTFELGFSAGTLNCDDNSVCYSVLLNSEQSFPLGAYNLRIFYDGDLLDLIDASPNLNPGSPLDASYAIGSVTDTQSGDQSANGTLPFDDNLSFIDVAVNQIGGTNPINTSTTSSIILYDLCFDIIDAAVFDDPSICIQAVWSNSATVDNYTVGISTVNVASGVGTSTVNDPALSTYNDLNPSGTQCLTNACATPVFELDFTDANVDCNTGEVCYNVTMEAPVAFELGAYNLRLFYDGGAIDLIDASPNLAGDAGLSANYSITSLNDMQGGDVSGSGTGLDAFDDNLDIMDVAVDLFGMAPLVITTSPQVVLYDVCFQIGDDGVSLLDPATCVQAVWVTNATEELYTVGETTVNIANTIGITTDIDNSIYNPLDATDENCLFEVCDECPAIACNDNVQISLDNMCAGVTLDMLLEGSYDHAVKIFVTGESGQTVSATSPSINDQFYANDTTKFDWSPYVGEIVKYTIVSECDGNSCWGETKLELNQLPSLESPCKVIPGAIVERVFTYKELIEDGPQMFTYPINDASCQIPATLSHSGELLYACSKGDDNILGTSDDGWCTASCNIIDDFAGTITVVFNPSPGDPTGAAIPASAVCKVKVEVPDCTECTAWCSEDGSRSYPDGFVTLEAIYEMMESGCFANIEGDIIKIEDVKGDACESLTTVSYYANVNIHGNIEKTLLLEQAFKTVKLDPYHVHAPNGPVILDCGSVSNEALPDEIYAETGSGSQAFPWFADKHNLIPETIEICGLAHYEVVVDTMDQLVAVDVDTDKDGIDDSSVWVLLPVVQKELRDSMYCETVGIAEDGLILVYDKNGDCLGDGTDFILTDPDDNPVVITSPAAYKGNGALAAGSNTCVEATVPATVHIDGGKYCNLIVSYSDQGPFEACGSGFKIIRTWQALDWCDGTVGGIHLGSQFIEVIDTEAPVFPALVDDAVSIDPWTCFAKYPLNIPAADDGCDGTTISYDIDVSAGRYDPVSGFIVDLLPQDSISIIVEVADDCYNTALDTFTLTVFDGVAPVPVCHENITVSLTTGGVAKVYAADFDAGSHDAGCGDVKVYAARMTGCCDDECAGGEEVCLEYNKFGECETWGNNPETDEYGDFVKFCCQDAGQKVMVAILVVDAAGNKNTCMVEATVVDKSAVTLACEDVTITCLDDMEDVSHASAIAAVCEGGAAEMIGETFNETGCGTGSVIREWYIDRDGDGTLTPGDAWCEQTITILPGDEHAFDPYTIKWPVHYTGEVYDGINLECQDTTELRQFSGERVPMGDVLACSSADLEDAPVWCSSPCGLVGYSVEEETVVASDACLKVIKRWTVIDWCTWDPNGNTPVDDANDSSSESFVAVADWTTPECYGCEDAQGINYYFRYDEVDKDGYYTFDQVIKVVDDSKPSIEVLATYVQSTDGGATSKNDDTECVGEGVISAVARDQCGGEDSGAEFLSWTINRLENGELAATKNATGETVEMSTGEGGPGDVHTIVWIASDGCGNSTTTETVVTFDDDRAPTPLCVSGVTTAFMEATGTVDIWALDFDLGSFDNCTDLVFTMVPSGVDPAQPGTDEFEAQKSYSLVCDDVTSFLEFNVWVWDANGLGDFCTVGVLVGGDCNPGEEASGLMIGGTIQTETGEMIQGVNTEISSISLDEYPRDMMTGTNGQYVFANNPNGFDFNIAASKSDDAMNGVSTLDLVLIQKHILGITSFASAYKVIASDANNDQNVTASDLLTLRKLILGIDEDFANNTSWRFVDADAGFVDTNSPWPFIETINISNLIQDRMNENFIGIKIGDVNGNATANALSKSETRTSGILSLQVEDKSLVSGQLVRVPVSSASFKDVYGFQYTVDHKGLNFRGVETGEIELTEEHIGQFDTSLTVSWEQADAVSTSETLFTLIFEATKDIQLSDVLDVTSNRLRSEIYVGSSLDVQTVDLVFNTNESDLTFSLDQNDPNPFSVTTTISFVLPQKGNATLQITNVSGEVIKTITGNYAKGTNNLTLSKEELNVSNGLYYYTLESNQKTVTRKMIVVSE